MANVVLDCMYITLKRSVYDVVRFRCSEEHRKGNSSLMRMLLNILNITFNDKSTIALSMRVIRLLGIVSLSGITAAEFKDYIKYLTRPSHLSIPLLQGLKTMLTVDKSFEKAYPASYFCLGGINSGLYVSTTPIVFGKDFQLAIWFRVESFVEGETVDEASMQHLVTCLNTKKEGFNVFLDKRSIKLFVADSSASDDPKCKCEEHTLRSGVWYHLVVSLAKPRWALFNRVQLNISIDDTVLFEDFVKLPRDDSALVSTTFVLGHNFDGMLGPCVIFSEKLPPLTMDIVQRVNAGLNVGGLSNNTAVDLMSASALKDPRLQPLVQKVVASYYPSRILNGRAVDVHGDKHALLMQPTYPWSGLTARVLVDSLGGVAFLLPLFPRLLIDESLVVGLFTQHAVSDLRDTRESVELGSSYASIYSDEDVQNAFSENAVQILSADKLRIAEEGCVSLLLSILTQCFSGRLATEVDMVATGVIEMLEFALMNVSPVLLRGENEYCALTLVLMQKAAEHAPLEALISKHLVFNFNIWQKCSKGLQETLLAIILEAFQSDPSRYLRSVGLSKLLQQLEIFRPSVSGTQSSAYIYIASIVYKITFFLCLGGNDQDVDSFGMYFRNSLYKMMWLLTKKACSVDELQPLLAFMDKCKDSVLLTEISQFLLCLVVDGKEEFASLLANVCNGAEGFASFVLFRLITIRDESVRAVGIRLITHFFNNYNLSASKNKSSSFLNLSAQESSGLSLFRMLGGFNLLKRMLSNYAATSSYLTYSALVEMMLSSRVGDSILSQCEFVEPGSIEDGPIEFKAQAVHSGKCIFTVKPFEVTAEAQHDSTQSHLAVSMLPVFFDLTEEMESLDRQKLLSDVLDIVKYNPRNCDVFALNPSWPCFIFKFLLPTMVLSEAVNRIHDVDAMLYLGCNIAKIDDADIVFEGVPLLDPSEYNISADGIFSLCMKIFSTVLLKDLESTAKSREFERILLGYSGNPLESLATKVIISYATSELSAAIRRRHSSLVKNASSFTFVENNAKDFLENAISCIITIAQLVVAEICNQEGGSLFERNNSWISFSKTKIDFTEIKEELPTSDENFLSIINILQSAPPLSQEDFRNFQLPSLERIVNSESAGLVLSIQCMDLFDNLFCNDKKGRHRQLIGVQYLRFQKDRRANTDAASLERNVQPTLLEAMLLLGIHILQDLSPFSTAAVANVQRISLILKSLADGPFIKTPTIDQLLMNLLGECLYLLFRVRRSLAMVYTYLGFDAPDDVFSSGESNEDEMDVYTTLVNADDVLFQRIYNNDGTIQVLDDLLGNDAGVQLLETVLEVLTLVRYISGMKCASILEAFNGKPAELLASFCNRIDEDLSCFTESVDTFRGVIKSVDTDVNAWSDNSFDGASDTGSSRMTSRHTSINEEEASTIISDTPTKMRTFQIHEIIALLSCLRDPFIGSTAIHLASTKLYYVPVFSQSLIDDLKGLKASTIITAPNEIMALGKMPDWSSRAREELSAEISLAKNSAFNWKSCLSKLEVEWSPWLVGKSNHNPVYELTRHRDSSLRRNLLMKSLETFNYSEAEYYEAKRTYQIQYGENGEGAGKRNSLQSLSSMFGKGRKHILRSQLGGWGDEGSYLFDMPTGSTKMMNSTSSAAADVGDEKGVYSGVATLVELERSISGQISFTNKHLYFHPIKIVENSVLNPRGRPLKPRKWVLECLQETYGRRHLLKNCGIEMFFADCPEVFFAFNSLEELQKFFFNIRRQNLPRLLSPPSLDPKFNNPLQKMWTDLWSRRLISNFEYLTHLNKLAGRSYNDLTQYPVFPWVIADYTSAVLDFTNPATFRDLTKPIGALNESNHHDIMERYSNFDDVDVPRFMYGSHYSSTGVVLHYLIRQEPFTSMAVNFQGGRFDCPDRLFFDVQRTWEGMWKSKGGDVKELIPEFFCCPDMFINNNKLPLGELQDQGTVDDVVLPPWARDAYEFVLLQREALESDYVSENLHYWIDLIFGYKQTGAAAVEALNVFSYVSYENAVDIDSILDPVEKESLIAQVINFGQTPSQLFETPHEKRHDRAKCEVPVCADDESIDNLTCITLSPQSVGTVTCVRSYQDKIITCYDDLSICISRWSTYAEAKAKKLPCASLSINASLNPSKRGSTSVVDMSSTRIVSCGYWDNSIRVHNLETLKEVASTTSGHHGAINCIAIDKTTSTTVVTGGADGTCRVWLLESSAIISSFREQAHHRDIHTVPHSALICVHVLSGHQSPVTALHYSHELDLLFSGSEDGSMCSHTVRKGEFARMVEMPNGIQVDVVYICPQGYLIAHSWQGLRVNLFSLNGQRLARVMVSAKVECFLSNPLSNLVVCGASDCSLSFLSLPHLGLLNSIDLTDTGGVKCFWFADGKHCFRPIFRAYHSFFLV